MMKKTLTHSLRTLALCASLLFASLAYGIELDAAKSQGLVGERADGYLGVVVEAPSAEVEQLVKDVNGKRRTRYETIATRNSISLDDIEARAGQKAIEMTPSGGWIFRTSWEQKK